MKTVHLGGRFAYLWLSLAMLTYQVAGADVPRTMSYQGVLTDAAGAIVPDGAYDLTFRIYNLSAAGLPLWSEAQPDVTVAGGLLTVMLGAVNPLALPFDVPYWLGVSVNGETELAPRMTLGAAPYALASANQPGIAQARGAGNPVIIGAVEALTRELSVTITIPAAGYIAVDASGMIGIHGAVGLQAAIYGIVETSALQFPAEWGYYYYAGFGTVPNGDYIDIPFFCRRTYYKSAAGSYTFSFGTGRLGSYNPELFTHFPVLNAVYFPTSYGTVTATAEQDASPIEPHGLTQQEDRR